MYKALKDFGDVKVGESVDVSTWTPEQISERIEDGTIELVAPVEKKYKFLKSYDGLESGALPEGAIVLAEVLTDKIEELLADGTIEEVTDESETPEVPEVLEASTPEVSEEGDAPAAKLYFNGKLIVSDGFREVEGIKKHHVKLEDGTNTDLNDEEYEKVLNPEK